jgi:hemerythrin-like domain-containing protein
MLHEHELGRQFIRAMGEAVAGLAAGERSLSQTIVENGRGYIALLKDHIEKENNVLFAMADRVLSADGQDELFAGFERIEEERIGLGKHEEFHHLLHTLRDVYLR